MPWPEKQRRAIFLNTKRRKGEKAAKALMHKHGYRSPISEALGKAKRS